MRLAKLIFDDIDILAAGISLGAALLSAAVFQTESGVSRALDAVMCVMFSTVTLTCFGEYIKRKIVFQTTISKDLVNEKIVMVTSKGELDINVSALQSEAKDE